MSSANGGGANIGEVVRAATQFVPHDFDSTYEPFYFLAQKNDAISDGIDTLIDPVGAREAYFRALTGCVGDESNLVDETNWYDVNGRWIALLKPPGERLPLPMYTAQRNRSYDPIGVFYKAECSDRRLPTVIVGSGYNGSQEDDFFAACSEILERELNYVTYKGPGQPTVRRSQSIGFISDCWTSESLVVDYLYSRPDVDTDKIALVGMSFRGTLPPLAASRDNRYSAVLAIDGLQNLQQVLNTSFPSILASTYASGNVSYYNEVVEYIHTQLFLGY